jgi:hypothetical protein
MPHASSSSSSWTDIDVLYEILSYSIFLTVSHHLDERSSTANRHLRFTREIAWLQGDVFDAGRSRGRGFQFISTIIENPTTVDWDICPDVVDVYILAGGSWAWIVAVPACKCPCTPGCRGDPVPSRRPGDRIVSGLAGRQAAADRVSRFPTAGSGRERGSAME